MGMTGVEALRWAAWQAYLTGNGFHHAGLAGNDKECRTKAETYRLFADRLVAEAERLETLGSITFQETYG